MEPFQSLGAKIAHGWRASHHDEAALPALAASAFKEAALHQTVDWGDVVRWFVRAQPLPEQRFPESTFGSPALTVFSGERFFIEVLFWLEGATSIHQHGFSGAFQVLAGGSLHCRYDFEDARRVNSHFSIGALAFQGAELLGVGDVREIQAGPRFIHATFHLERPTVTVVVRTLQDPDQQPQLAYRWPGVAEDPFFHDAVQARRVQALELLLQARPAEYFALLPQLMASADLELGFKLLRSAHARVRQSHLYTELVGQLRERFGSRVDTLERVLDESARKEALQKKRDASKDPIERFVLAVEQNVPDRAAALALVRSRFPSGDADAWVSS